MRAGRRGGDLEGAREWIRKSGRRKGSRQLGEEALGDMEMSGLQEWEWWNGGDKSLIEWLKGEMERRNADSFLRRFTIKGNKDKGDPWGGKRLLTVLLLELIALLSGMVQ